MVARAVSDDGGQALVVAVLLIGIAAAAIVGLRAAQERILETARQEGAGEAAVTAAASVYADAYVGLPVSLRASARPAAFDARRLVADVATREAARLAAADLAARNRGASPSDVAARCAGRQLEVTLTVAGIDHHAGFPAPECSRR